MTAFSRELPKRVQQYKDDRFTCWAAALESWMSVTPQSPASWFLKTQDDAMVSWKSFTKNGSLEVKWGFRLMAAAVGMEYGVFVPAKKITGAFLYSKLKLKSHLYIFYAGGETRTSAATGHCVVIYGISNPWGNDCKISCMDPYEGNYVNVLLSDSIHLAAEAVVGWFEYTAT